MEEKHQLILINLKINLEILIPPSNIYIDTVFLKKLKKKDIKSGIGEMVHLLAVKSFSTLILFTNITWVNYQLKN